MKQNIWYVLGIVCIIESMADGYVGMATQQYDVETIIGMVVIVCVLIALIRR